MQRFLRITRNNICLKYISLNFKPRRKSRKDEFERVLVSFHHYIAAEWCISFFTIISMLRIDASKFYIPRYGSEYVITRQIHLKKKITHLH